MAQKLPKVQEVTNLKATDTLIVVDESAQVTNPDTGEVTTGALRRIKKEETGFATEAEVKSELLNLYITKSASGSIASFSDGADDVPMKSLKVNIVPKQSGSGDPSPSNVRPISGYDTVNVKRVGANLFNIDGGRITLGNFKAGTKFYMQSNIDSQMTVYARINGAGVEMGWVGSLTVKKSFTLNADADAITISQADYNSLVSNGKWLMLSLQDFDTYEPYQGTSYPISLGQTVYGGSLDVVSGKLTLTKKGVVYNGSENWRVETQAGSPSFYIARPSDDKPIADVDPNNMLCNVCPVYRATTKAGTMRITSGYYNFILGTALGISTVAEWETWLSNNNVTVVYELATPTEIQLTPTEVNTLLGNNNIWSESGTVEVEYRADSTLVYNEILSLIANL